MLRWFIIIVATLLEMGCFFTGCYLGRPIVESWWHQEAPIEPIERLVTAVLLIMTGFIGMAIAWVTKQENE